MLQYLQTKVHFIKIVLMCLAFTKKQQKKDQLHKIHCRNNLFRHKVLIHVNESWCWTIAQILHETVMHYCISVVIK